MPRSIGFRGGGKENRFPLTQFQRKVQTNNFLSLVKVSSICCATPCGRVGGTKEFMQSRDRVSAFSQIAFCMFFSPSVSRQVTLPYPPAKRRGSNIVRNHSGLGGWLVSKLVWAQLVLTKSEETTRIKLGFPLVFIAMSLHVGNTTYIVTYGPIYYHWKNILRNFLNNILINFSS